MGTIEGSPSVTGDEEKSLALRIIYYEMKQCAEAYRSIRDKEPHSRWAHNALVESCLVHARNLHSFFRNKPDAKHRDNIIVGSVDQNVASVEPLTMDQLRRIHKGVAHPSAEREPWLDRGTIPLDDIAMQVLRASAKFIENQLSRLPSSCRINARTWVALAELIRGLDARRRTTGFSRTCEGAGDGHGTDPGLPPSDDSCAATQP